MIDEHMQNFSFLPFVVQKLWPPKFLHPSRQANFSHFRPFLQGHISDINQDTSLKLGILKDFFPVTQNIPLPKFKSAL